MATWSWLQNQTPTNGAATIYNLKTQLVSAGGVVLSSGSSAATYNSSGDAISSSAILATNNAWFRIRDRQGTRSFVFQRGTTNVAWRIKYSGTAGFTGGTPSTTQTPSATDEVYIVGGGSDAVPTFTNILGTDGTYRQQIGTDTDAGGSWWFVTYPNGGGAPNGGIVVDTVTKWGAGTDADPTVIYKAHSGTVTNFQQPTLSASSFSTGSSGCGGWLKKGVAGEAFVGIGALSYYHSATMAVPGNIGSNPDDASDEGYPIIYGRSANLAAPVGSKGMSSTMRWLGTNRSTGDRVSVDTSNDRLIVANVTFEWNGAAVTL